MVYGPTASIGCFSVCFVVFCRRVFFGFHCHLSVVRVRYEVLIWLSLGVQGFTALRLRFTGFEF